MSKLIIDTKLTAGVHGEPFIGAILDEENKLISNVAGCTEFNIKALYYSLKDSNRFDIMGAFGGQKISNSIHLGLSFFCRNGWRIALKPGETIIGCLPKEDIYLVPKQTETEQTISQLKTIKDCDELDREMVIVDPISQKISIRILGERYHKSSVSGSVKGRVLKFHCLFDFHGFNPGDIVSIHRSDAIGVMGHYSILNTVSSKLGFFVVLDREVCEDSTDVRFTVSKPNKKCDGLSLQCLYSFLMEEWKALDDGYDHEDLLQYSFPFTVITREQMIIGGVNGCSSSSWSFADENGSDLSPRKLIRYGGWVEKDENDKIIAQYANIITLGKFSEDAQVDYSFSGEDGFKPFSRTGPVNEAIKIESKDNFMIKLRTKPGLETMDHTDLSRRSVVIDPYCEKISVRMVGDSYHDNTVSGTAIRSRIMFDSPDSDFKPFKTGDIVSVLNSEHEGAIGHYTIKNVIKNRYGHFLSVDRPIHDTTKIEFKVSKPSDRHDGVSLSSLYAFLKATWIKNPPGEMDLMRYTFPFRAVTREQMILGGVHGDARSSWTFADNNGDVLPPRKLIRYGGWVEKDSDNITLAEYSCIVTLGKIDPDSQVYYQWPGDDQSLIPFSRKGPVNEAVLVLNADHIKIVTDNITLSLDDIDVTRLEPMAVRFPVPDFGHNRCVSLKDIGATELEPMTVRFPLFDNKFTV